MSLAFLSSQQDNSYVPPTVVQQTSVGVNGTTLAIIPAFGSAFTPGSVIVVGICCSDVTVITGVGQSGTTYTKIDQSLFDNGGTAGTVFFLSAPVPFTGVPPSGNIGITLSSSKNVSAIALEVKNVDSFELRSWPACLQDAQGQAGSTAVTLSNIRRPAISIACFGKRGTGSTSYTTTGSYTIINAPESGPAGTDVKGAIAFLSLSQANTSCSPQGNNASGSSPASSHIILHGKESAPRNRIKRIQSQITGAQSVTTLPVTLGSTPIDGNRLIALISRNNGTSATGPQVSSISQTGVTWTYLASHGVTGATTNSTNEVWISSPCSSASNSITITPIASGKSMVVCILEYEGLRAEDYIDEDGSGTSAVSTWSTGTFSTDLLCKGTVAPYTNKVYSKTLQLTTVSTGSGTKTYTLDSQSTGKTNTIIGQFATAGADGLGESTIFIESIVEEASNQVNAISGTLSANRTMYMQQMAFVSL